MTGDGDDWDVDELVELGIDEDETVDGPFGEKPWIPVDEVWLSLMADNKVKIPGLEQMLFQPIHDHGEIAFTELGHDDADGEALAHAQGAGEKIGLEIEFSGAPLEHAFPRF